MTSALHIFTDGAYDFASKRHAYGWVLANGWGSMTTARVVSDDSPKTFRGAGGTIGSQMEAAAIVDAIAEFAPRGLPLVLHTDTQCLPGYIEKYRRGEVDASFFLTTPGVIREEDGWRLLRYIDSVDVTFNWVKGHSKSFHNLVIDQALRIAAHDNMGDRPAVAFTLEALASCKAVIWGKCMTRGEYYNGFKAVTLLPSGEVKERYLPGRKAAAQAA